MLILLIILFNAVVLPSQKDHTIFASSVKEPLNISAYMELLEEDYNSIEDILTATDKFKPINREHFNKDAAVQWLKFSIHNDNFNDAYYKLSTVFSDSVVFFSYNGKTIENLQHTGDLIPVNKRSVPLGQMVMISIRVPAYSTHTCYIRIESKSSISQQFRSMALKSFNLYTDGAYIERYFNSRIYQAMFYGALIIMLLYNFVIFISLKDRSYLYYVVFISSMLIFLSAGNGYLAETIFLNVPRTDLYIRFISVPVVMILYILFSNSYLKYTQNIYRYRIIKNSLLVYFIILIVLMITNNWMMGRTLGIVGAALTFIYIFILSIVNLNKGFTPARYFIAANSMLIFSGIMFAYFRIFSFVQDPSTQYFIQIAAIVKVAIFSLGLTDRINIIRRELENKRIENIRLEKEKEVEKSKIIAEKNKELEERVVKRTLEIIEQKEEIETQKEWLEENNLKLQKAQEIINLQNATLIDINKNLEEKVKERTFKLEETNQNLKKANEELDHFIYRTAHDIRGPLARFLGLCNVAIMDVKDKVALEYLDMLNYNAHALNNILRRLTSIHELKTHELKVEFIDFNLLIDKVLSEVFKENEIVIFDVRKNISEDLEFYSDQYLLNLIFENLLENSKKFRKTTLQELPFINIEVHKHEDMLQILVIDNGKGIKKEDQHRLFQMFSKTSEIQKKPGFGLYIVKLCVERLGGTIKLNKDCDRVTEFKISIPYTAKSNAKYKSYKY